MWQCTLSGILESGRKTFHRNKPECSILSFLARSGSYTLGKSPLLISWCASIVDGKLDDNIRNKVIQNRSLVENRTQVLAQCSWLICSGPMKYILLLLIETIQQPSLVVTWVLPFCYPTLFWHYYNYFKVGYHLIPRICIFMVQSLPFCI